MGVIFDLFSVVRTVEMLQLFLRYINLRLALTLQEIGSVGGSLIIWPVCGIISLIGALCYSELGTSILRSGGDYAYITEALGCLPGFLFLWCAVIVLMPAGIAISSLTFAYYILQPFFPTCESPESAVRLVAASAVCEYLCFVWFEIRLELSSQFFLLFVFLFTFFLLSGLCLPF